MAGQFRRLSFNAEWYQEEAGIVRPYTIFFYESDNSVEVFDQRSKRVFLRRTKMDQLSARDFYIGSKINVFGRQFDIVDYCDVMTKNSLAKYRKKTFLLLKNKVIQHLGKLLTALIESDFTINKALMVKFRADQVTIFLSQRSKGDAHTTVLMNELLAGPAIGFELIADYAYEKIKACIADEKENYRYDGEIPAPLAEFFSQLDLRAGFYCSDTEESVERDSDYFFAKKNALQMNCRLDNTTLCIIKPHSIKEGTHGKIISEILNNGFEITALSMHLMERVNCEEFYEVYRGVLPEYISIVAQLASGKIICMEIACQDQTKNTHEEFRNFCGPMDPEIAKLLRPHTLRAKFGTTRTCNAVHCTDLPEDTTLELQYLFKILD